MQLLSHNESGRLTCQVFRPTANVSRAGWKHAFQDLQDRPPGGDRGRCALWGRCQGQLKVRHKGASAAMMVPFLSGLLSSLGPACCQFRSDRLHACLAGGP
jgi:hypothetical protein